MKSERFESQTYYDILEVSPKAAPQEIHAAYQRAKETYSTDSPALYTMFTPEEAKALLVLIEEAFDTLSNQGRRQMYDQRLAERPKSIESARTAKKVASAPKELPDFRVDENAPVAKPLTLAKAPSNPANAVPPGMAKTKFGVYPLDPTMEKEIQEGTFADGEFLKRVRVYKKISVDQMCDETRINKPYLLAVEANDYKSLPAPVFVRGFIIQLARVLGLNDKKLAEGYMQRLKNQSS